MTDSESNLKVDIFPAKTTVKGIPLENSQDKIVITHIPSGTVVKSIGKGISKEVALKELKRKILWNSYTPEQRKEKIERASQEILKDLSSEILDLFNSLEKKAESQKSEETEEN